MTVALNPALGFVAGGLTILSPCVLPLVPVVMGSAAQANRHGPLALAAGMVIAFTATGMAVAALSNSANFDPEWVRYVGAALLFLAGVFLLVQQLQDRFARATGPLANWASAQQARMERFGLTGQFAIGALLGLVWSPCVGPTLGAATVLAAQGKNLGEVALTMVAFGLGIATVLMIIAYLTRAAFAARRGGMMALGKAGKRGLGIVLMVVGVMIFTGADRILEGLILQQLPESVVDFSVQA